MEFAAWKGFKGGHWQQEIDLRDFIQQNYTPYLGDEGFLTPATDRTKSLMHKLEGLFRLEQEFGILTRCGLHCAPAAHRSLGTFPQGTIRFSLGFANTEQDVDAAVAALRAISAG